MDIGEYLYIRLLFLLPKNLYYIVWILFDIKKLLVVKVDKAFNLNLNI
jgi:hypothetical protein